MHNLGQGKDEADEPGMLVEPPEMEGDAAGSNPLICRFSSRRARDPSSLC